MTDLRAAIFVEGASDEEALKALARRRGRDLDAEGVSIVPMGGAHGIRRFLNEFGPTGLAVRLAGLCDAGEEHEVRRALQLAGMGAALSRSGMEDIGFFVCEPDLEGELIRALRADVILRVLDSERDLSSFRTLQKQAPWLGRPVEDQLRRFFGSIARRKFRYASLLADAVDLDRVPPPLDGVLAHVS